MEYGNSCRQISTSKSLWPFGNTGGILNKADDEFDRIAKRWYAENDQQRLRLVDWFREALSYRETHPERQAELAARARDEAVRLNEAWLALYFGYWMLDAIATGQQDFVSALPLAAELIERFNSPDGRAHPSYNAVMAESLYVHAETDPFGYSDILEEGFAALDPRIESGPHADRYAFDHRRAAYLHATEQWKNAYEVAVQSLGMANLYSDRSQAANLEFLLCRICRNLRRWDELGEFAESLAEISARDARLRRHKADGLLWIAYLQLSQGDGRIAAKSFQAGMHEMEQLNRRDEICYEPIAAYLELKGLAPVAIRYIDREIANSSKSGRFHRAAQSHIERCRLLKLSGELRELDLNQAREAALRTKLPGRYLDKLDRATNYVSVGIIANGGELFSPSKDSHKIDY